MCCECGCGLQGHNHEGHNRPIMNFSPFMSVEEEVKSLEELKETLEDRLNKVSKRLEDLKR